MRLSPAGIGKPFLTQDYRDQTRLRVWVVVTLWAVVIVGAIVGIVYGITKGVRSAGAASCHTLAQESGYGTNYRIQHFLDAGTCYVHLPNGHSLPEKLVSGFIKADK